MTSPFLTGTGPQVRQEGVLLHWQSGVEVDDITPVATTDPLPVAQTGAAPRPRYAITTPIVADATVKTGACVLHTVVITANDAVATAGTIAIYDGTSAAGVLIFKYEIAAAALAPLSILLDVEIATGIFIDFTTVADVNVSVTYGSL